MYRSQSNGNVSTNLPLRRSTHSIQAVINKDKPVMENHNPEVVATSVAVAEEVDSAAG